MKRIYYRILTDKRCSENTNSIESMGLDGMLELYEMICVRDAYEEASMPDTPKSSSPTANPHTR